MSLPSIVSSEDWVAARKELLGDEKELTRRRDEVNTKRRQLPMVEVVEDYVFDDPEQPERGELRLLDLFDGRRQLVVYHAMWLDDEGLACPSCSAFLDQVGHLAHLNTRDTTFAAISRGPLDLMRGFKKRMEWAFPWYSSRRSDFNYDFHVTFDESRAPIEYNYRHKHELEAAGFNLDDWAQPFDLHGMSVFLRDGDRVFHTYSTYARGVDNLGFVSNFLDLTALGRQESWEEPGGRASDHGAGAGDQAMRYHDEYDE